MSETDGCGSDALTTSELSSTSSDGSANSAEAEAAELAAETGATAGDDPSSWAEPQDETLRELIAKEHHDDAVLKYHLFLGHRQVDASSRIGEIYEIMTSRLKLKCWRDITEKLQDVPTMIRGVAQSSVYLLYLTRTDDGETAGNKDGGALSYYVTIEARAAMKLKKPAVVLIESDGRKPTHAGGSLETALEGWPSDLSDYFRAPQTKLWRGEDNQLRGTAIFKTHL